MILVHTRTTLILILFRFLLSFSLCAVLFLSWSFQMAVKWIAQLGSCKLQKRRQYNNKAAENIAWNFPLPIRLLRVNYHHSHRCCHWPIIFQLFLINKSNGRHCHCQKCLLARPEHHAKIQCVYAISSNFALKSVVIANTPFLLAPTSDLGSNLVSTSFQNHCCFPWKHAKRLQIHKNNSWFGSHFWFAIVRLIISHYSVTVEIGVSAGNVYIYITYVFGSSFHFVLVVVFCCFFHCFISFACSEWGITYQLAGNEKIKPLFVNFFGKIKNKKRRKKWRKKQFSHKKVCIYFSSSSSLCVFFLQSIVYDWDWFLFPRIHFRAQFFVHVSLACDWPRKINQTSTHIHTRLRANAHTYIRRIVHRCLAYRYASRVRRSAKVDIAGLKCCYRFH